MERNSGLLRWCYRKGIGQTICIEWGHPNTFTQKYLLVNSIASLIKIWQDLQNITLPISGLFDVIGMMDDTVFRKMVSDSKIVTPEM